MIAKAQVEAKALIRNILSSRVRANRLKILEEKNRIVQSVLGVIEERLSSVVKEPQFQEALKKFVTEAVAAVGVDQPIVNVGFADFPKQSLGSVEQVVPRGTKVVVSEKPIDDLGGVVVTDGAGKIVFNNSFRARLDRMDNQLLTVLSSTLFGE